MSKAFLRETDVDQDGVCPRCGGRGQAVSASVVRRHAVTAAAGRIVEPLWFCPMPSCAVAYFDAFKSIVGTDELTAPVAPKDPRAPLCACFGLTAADVAADAAEGAPTRVRALIARAQSPAARCATLAANGQSCVPAVRKLLLELQRKA
jgi:hypothetical protein